MCVSLISFCTLTQDNFVTGSRSYINYVFMYVPFGYSILITYRLYTNAI